MGTFALIDARIEINSVVMSDDITSVTHPFEVAAIAPICAVAAQL